MFTPYFSGLDFCCGDTWGGVSHLQVRLPQGGASRQRDGIKERGGREKPRRPGARFLPPWVLGGHSFDNRWSIEHLLWETPGLDLGKNQDLGHRPCPRVGA